MTSSADLAVGTTCYHWRYGPLTIVAVNGHKLEARIEDHDGIIEALDDPWTPYVHDQTKWWLTDSVGQWLFTSPDDVGQTAGLATHDLLDRTFLARLHSGFDRAAVVAKSSIDPALRMEILEAEAARREQELARKREELARRKEKELERKRGQCAQTAAKLQSLLDQKAGLEAERAAYQQRLDVACNALATKPLKIEDLEGEQSPIQLTANQPVIERLKGEIEQAEHERDEMQAGLDRCDSALTPLGQEEIRLDSERAAVDAQIAALEAELASLRS